MTFMKDRVSSSYQKKRSNYFPRPVHLTFKTQSIERQNAGCLLASRICDGALNIPEVTRLPPQITPIGVYRKYKPKR